MRCHDAFGPVFPICGRMEGEMAPIEGVFSNGLKIPPAHPKCRCAVAYRTDPSYKPDMEHEFDWLQTATQEQKEQFLGGKTKRALYDAGLVEQDDYFKPLTEIRQSGIVLVGERALNHPTVGDYLRPGKEYPKGRLRGGCHTQEGIAELEKRGIAYNMTDIHTNGVRFGNIPGHRQPFKRRGNGQAWFPESWTREDVRIAGLYVANRGDIDDSENSPAKVGIWKDVNVRVIFSSDGGVSTVHPSYDQ